MVGPDGATLDRRMVITRLGAGVDRDRSLATDAIGRTLDVLRGYRSAMDEHGVERVRAVATSAVRDATNGSEFLRAAAEVLGATPELLSGSEEGRLSFEGATATLPTRDDAPVLVVDIGGGSTELVLGHPGAPEAAAVASVDIGCVRISERFLSSDPPRADELAAAAGAAAGLIGEAARSLQLGSGSARLIGLAGTVSAAAVMDSGASEYDYELVHHRILTLGRVRELLARLAALDHAERIRFPGLEPARADVIVGGLVVLVAVMEQFGSDQCLASEADILDGLVHSLLAPA